MGGKRKERHTSGFNPDDYADELERLEALRLSMRDELTRGLYPDPNYPLWDGQRSLDPKLTPEQRDKQLCNVTPEKPELHTAVRLKSAYDRAKKERQSKIDRLRKMGAFDRAKEVRPLTLAEWAARCSNHGASRNVASKWLESPSIMERSEVLATCELFGCSLAYLQGREWDAERVIEVYEVLSTESRVKLCSYLSDLDELEWLHRPDEYRRAAARVAERRAAKDE